MTIEKFNEAIRNQLTYCTELLTAKGREYSGDDFDRLESFKKAATLEGITPVQALAGMMAKHTVSIYDMCNSEEPLPLGKWIEKITDHINYLLILRAMLEEGAEGYEQNRG